MPNSFDPYYEWLQIPPQEQPPTLYRLLGLSPFEANPAAIQSAADQRMTYLRTFQLGQRGPESQRMLNQLAAAKLLLLDANRRAAYNLVLRSAAPAVALEETAAGGGANATAGADTPVANRPIPIPKPGEFAPGGSLAKYRILEAVSGSAHARTLKVQQIDTGRFYFLKFIPRDSAPSVEVVKRFDRECEILTALDHPNLIVGHETFQHDGTRFLVMEYVLGTDLATLVTQQGPLGTEQAVDFLLQAARGLEQLHTQGIYHRNLKPHVLLVDLQGRLRITNLLLAKIVEKSPMQDEQLTTMGESLGSLDYMPPEQSIDARQADARSDVYALGCTLFHLLAGRPPFVAKGPMQKILAHRQTPPPALASVRADIPVWLEEVFQKSLSKDPRERYQTAGELIAALDPPTVLPLWRSWLWKLGLGR